MGVFCDTFDLGYYSYMNCFTVGIFLAQTIGPGCYVDLTLEQMFEPG